MTWTALEIIPLVVAAAIVLHNFLRLAVPMLVGLAILALQLVWASLSALWLVFSGKLDEAEDQLAKALTKKPYDQQVKDHHAPGRRHVVVDFDRMTPDEIAKAIEEVMPA